MLTTIPVSAGAALLRRLLRGQLARRRPRRAARDAVDDLLRDGLEGLGHVDVGLGRRLDEPHVVNGSAERMKQILWPIVDNKFLKSPGLGFKMLLPNELYRFIEREDESFNQRARLDKQNLIPELETPSIWVGQSSAESGRNRPMAKFVHFANC